MPNNRIVIARSNRRNSLISGSTLATLGRSAGRIIAYGATRGKRTLRDFASAAAGAATVHAANKARKIYDGVTSTPSTTIYHNSGMSLRRKRKRKTKAQKKKKRGRAKRIRRFRKNVIQSMNPRTQYRQLVTFSLLQDYNKKMLHSPAQWLTRSFLSSVAQNYATKAGVTVSTTDGKMWVMNSYIRYTITNDSPTKTYVTVYWFRYRDNTTKAPVDLLTEDITKGYIAAGTYAVGTDTVTYQLDLTSKLSDFKTIFEFAKCIDKQEFLMDGGGVVNSMHKMRRAYPYVYNAQEESNDSNYVKNVTEFPLILAKSQLVRNGGATPNAVYDNARLLLSFDYRCHQAADLIKKWIGPTYVQTLNAATGTPTAFVEDSQQNT